MVKTGPISGIWLPVCGVTVEGDKVIALDLQDNNLVGEILRILLIIRSRELNFHKNAICGTIPASLQNLKI
jgi:hypothetical protein